MRRLNELLDKLLSPLPSQDNEPSLEDLDALRSQCLREIKANTPEGWNAEAIRMTDGVSYCYAVTLIKGHLATIPARLQAGWIHAGYDGNGLFGYKMNYGQPWRTPQILRTADGCIVNDRRGGAEIRMRHEDAGRTYIGVLSHPFHYKEAVDLAQSSIVDQARSGYLRVTQAPAAQP